MHPGCSSASLEMWIKNEVRSLSGLINPHSAQTDGLSFVWPGWDLTFDPAGLLQRRELWASSFTHLLSVCPRLDDIAVIHHLAALCSVPAPRSCPRPQKKKKRCCPLMLVTAQSFASIFNYVNRHDWTASAVLGQHLSLLSSPPVSGCYRPVAQKV